MGEDSQDGLTLDIKTETKYQIIYPWYLEKNDSYFFIPAFVLDNRIYNLGNEGKEIVIDGQLVSPNCFFQWQEAVVYTVKRGAESYSVLFMQSANLPTFLLWQKPLRLGKDV